MENSVKVKAFLKFGSNFEGQDKDYTTGYLSGRIYNRSGEGINTPIEDLASDLRDSGLLSEFDTTTGELIRIIPVSNIDYLKPL